jgi:3-dehydroquinate synthase
MSVIGIHSSLRDYTVHFQNNDSFVEGFSRFPQRLFVIDENVWRLHCNGCLSSISESERMIFAVSEDRKNLDSVMEIYDRLMKCSAKKNMTLISIGGGIIQDITGFVASTLYRGLNWVFVPTTLLAQADSCIGSKTSLNYKRFKNLIGTFYPPSEVHIYSLFLQTLEKCDFLSGMGEVTKLHIMGGADTISAITDALPAILRREKVALLSAIRRSLAVKLSYMEGDEFDTGRRNLLNYGHCFGHALETVCNYTIPHGQAVVIGMLVANRIAVRRGLLSAESDRRMAEQLLALLRDFKLELSRFSTEELVTAMKQDKKRVGEGLVMVMITDKLKLVKADDVTSEEVETALSNSFEY